MKSVNDIRIVCRGNTKHTLVMNYTFNEKFFNCSSTLLSKVVKTSRVENLSSNDLVPYNLIYKFWDSTVLMSQREILWFSKVNEIFYNVLNILHLISG